MDVISLGTIPLATIDKFNKIVSSQFINLKSRHVLKPVVLIWHNTLAFYLLVSPMEQGTSLTTTQFIIHNSL